jgi:HAD superfamily hydrolase (TIGR01509 family)
MTPKPEVLLFDLGGVVIDIDFDRALKHWQPMSSLSLEELRTAFRFDEPYQRHERGEITAGEYFAHLRATLQLQGDAARIEQGWNAIYVGEIAETLAMVQAVRTRIPCCAFTNTNASHQAAWSAMYPAVVQAFDRIFSSHEMGHRKPDRRAFEHIGQALGVPLGSIMFFDDLLANVEGAAAAGLRAVYVRSPEDVRKALQAVS